MSISAPQRVSLDYFAALDDLAERHGLPLYAHMLETKVQRTLMTEQPRFAGRSLVRYTAAAGLLKPHTNVIHAVWVDDADLDVIADAGSTVVHNPVSNLRLGSGVLPWRAMLDHGIPVALGTDEAICDDTINVWTVAKTAGLIHNVSGLDSDEWPTPAEILDALWRGGARATRRADDLGAIAPGMLADLALVDLHAVAFTPLNDLREQLVHCEDGRDVVLTMVAGRVVAEHGHVTSVDESALLDEARELFAAKLPAIRAARGERRPAVPRLPAHRAPRGRNGCRLQPLGGAHDRTPPATPTRRCPPGPTGTLAQRRAARRRRVRRRRVLPVRRRPHRGRAARRARPRPGEHRLAGLRQPGRRLPDLRNASRPWHPADGAAEHRRLRRGPGRAGGGPPGRRRDRRARPVQLRLAVADDPRRRARLPHATSPTASARTRGRPRAAGPAPGSATPRRP